MSEAVSLNPEDFTEGGGLIDDIDVILKENVFDMFDYNGTVQPGVPSLKITMDHEGDNVIQYYSMGSANDWLPSEDGKQLIAVGKAQNIRLSSNGGIFLKSLIDAGFPADKLSDDISILDGLQAHVIRVPAPKRPGLEKKEKKYEDTILIVSEIKALPWEKKTPKGAPAKAASKAAAGKKAPAKKEEATEGDDASDEATNVILAILADAGSVSKKELPGMIFKTEKDNPNRNDIIKMAFDEEFLNNGPWNYEDGVLISS